MHLTNGRNDVRRRPLVVLGAVALLGVLIGYGVLHSDGVDGVSASSAADSPTVRTDGTHWPSAIAASTAPRAPAPPPARPADLPVTDDPQVYASAVASTLFSMDQRTYLGADYLSLLEAARVPDAVELIPELTDDAFIAALSERIPDEYMWQRMRDSGQWATFEVTRVWEPDYVATKRATGELPDGVHGLNVAGTQTIHYLDEDGQPAERDRAQAVSLLVACEPVHSSCQLMAISTGVVE